MILIDSMSRKEDNTTPIIGGIVGCFVLLVMVVIVLFFVKKRMWVFILYIGNIRIRQVINVYIPKSLSELFPQIKHI